MSSRSAASVSLTANKNCQIAGFKATTKALNLLVIAGNRLAQVDNQVLTVIPCIFRS